MKTRYFSDGFPATASEWSGSRSAVTRLMLPALLSLVSISLSRAEEAIKTRAAEVDATPRLIAAVSVGTNAVPRPSSSPSGSQRSDVRAVELAETPSAAVVVETSPLLEKPAAAALAEMSARPPSPVLDSRMNRETLEESIERGKKLYTPEQSGSAIRYLRHKPTWRGLWDLFDPTAPVVKPDYPAATAFETRREIGPAPRAFRDATTHEPELRIY